MRIIARQTLRDFVAKKKYAAARGEIALWSRVAYEAEWKQLLDVQKDYVKAEAVQVRKDSYTVFNICGNKFRLIVLIHYRKGIIWIKDFLTHAEYETDNWKRTLKDAQVEREKVEKTLRRGK